MGKFGTDGIRGMAGKDIDAFMAMRVGMAVGIHFRSKVKTNRILVGKDTRRSGYMIENALVSGLTAVGYDVIQIGPMPTPAIAFLTEDMRCDAGVMITASHNPYYDNGLKIFNSLGNKLEKSDEIAISEIIDNEELIRSSFKTGSQIGRSKRIDDVIGRYIVHIKQSFPQNLTLQGLRVVLDCANGAGYIVAPTILQELGAEVIEVAVNPNGFNINTDCGAMHPEKLAKLVKELRADIGIALDGDADRIIVVDELGEVVDGDKLMGALAIYLKEQKELRSDDIVVTSMSNGALDDFLKTKGISVHRSDVGDKYVMELMRKIGSNFGGEQSGHVIFSDFAKTGDGLLSALQVLAYMLDTNLKASEALTSLFELYPQHQANLVIADKPQLSSIEGYNDFISEIENQGLRHLIRYSGTEKKIRILIEGKNSKVVEEMGQKAKDFFKKAIG
ncbi:MAG: phosphoglucosamine mutase [Epsilonproteobacteria bacterium]|nr:phosphoglucosamine mutase [Campylobacterota bacterium]MBD3839280.1 phosphoglucosamine mutase [Campylobacterota bacterium]